MTIKELVTKLQDYYFDGESPTDEDYYVSENDWDTFYEYDEKKAIQKLLAWLKDNPKIENEIDLINQCPVADWAYYIEKHIGHKDLCFNRLVELADKGAVRSNNGYALYLWSMRYPGDKNLCLKAIVESKTIEDKVFYINKIYAEIMAGEYLRAEKEIKAQFQRAKDEHDLKISREIERRQKERMRKAEETKELLNNPKS